MNMFRILQVAIFLLCISGFAAAAWSDDAAKTARSAQEAVGQEAIVSAVENDLIMLRSAEDRNRTCTIPRNNAAEQLKVGDKVKVQGNIVKKIEAKAEPAVQAPSVQGAPAATP